MALAEYWRHRSRSWPRTPLSEVRCTRCCVWFLNYTERRRMFTSTTLRRCAFNYRTIVCLSVGPGSLPGSTEHGTSAGTQRSTAGRLHHSPLRAASRPRPAPPVAPQGRNDWIRPQRSQNARRRIPPPPRSAKLDSSQDWVECGIGMSESRLRRHTASCVRYQGEKHVLDLTMDVVMTEVEMRDAWDHIFMVLL